MKVGIVGASGYSGEALVRALLGHPCVELALISSRQHAGKPLSEVIPSVRGLAEQLLFVDSDPAALAARADIELYFLALPHGAAAHFAEALVQAGKRVIDLSADFRIADPAVYQEFYGTAHPNPELLAQAAYVIPELAGEKWKKLSLIAAPGCYPTSVLIPLIPLLRKRLIEPRGIVVNSFSGVSGAGRKLAEDFLFCERAESAKAYGIPKHRHLAEMEEQLSQAAGTAVVLQFNPHLAPMRRGIATTVVARATQGAEIGGVYAAWNDCFAGSPFVSILPAGQTPDTQYVVGTNRIDLAAVFDARTENFVITSAEDNLLKGAGGQAVQIMNRWYGFPEAAGLR